MINGSPSGELNKRPDAFAKRAPLLRLLFSSLLWLSANGVVSAAAPYQWKSVAIHGGGFVPGIIFHPTVPGLAYARTDVGGAYRWNVKSKTWVAITDWISRNDQGLMGCESIALDPQDPNRVYLALGMYTNSWGQNGAIARSSDQGKTFARTDMPFKMGGNCPGRSVGERLAVDPNDGRVLFFGSRPAGLWKSTDQAKTWNKVDSFPAIAVSSSTVEVDGSEQWALGISFVKFDPASGHRGNPTPIIYAGIATQQASVFRSIDGGSTWAALPNQPTGFRPNHMAISPTGLIYISYGDQVGPNDTNDGALWLFNPKTSQWTDVTPVKPTKDDHFSYAAVTLDPQHPTTLMTCSIDRWSHGDTIFRSTNGGKTWNSQTVGGSQHDPTILQAPDAHWGLTLAPHWLGDVEMDPFNTDHVFFVTGFGIWSTQEASQIDSGKPAHWSFDDAGLEEVVPLELISPTAGAHLISVIGDFDGFTHDNLDQSPSIGRHQPSIGTTSGLDFAGKMPNRIVRAGGHAQGFYSDDHGETWQAFPSHPANGTDGGSIAISSNGKTIVWTPERAVTSWSTDLGKTWTPSQGLPHPLNPVSDRADAKRFYAFDSESGQLFVSQNSGESFTAAAGSLPKSWAQLRAVFDHPGELWLATDNRLYHSSDAGRSFMKILTTDNDDKIGFGKAAPGQNYPAIFISGAVNGIQGVFRSDDTARSWVRINDNQHQFGGLNIVIGDPRIYGRVYLGTTGRGIVYGDFPQVRK